MRLPIPLLLLLLSCSRTTEFIGSVSVPAWNCGLRCFRDENLPEDPEGLFAAAVDPANGPELHYPLAGSVHPINLGPPTFQWRSDRGLGYYRVRVVAVADPGRRYDFYVPCRPPPNVPILPAPDECTYPMPPRAWDVVARENRDAEVSITIEASDRATVPISDPVRVSFSPEAIEAGIYYFAQDRQGIMRALIGGAVAQEFILPNKPANRFSCASCHAVSRDGRTVAFTAEARSGYFSAARAAAPAPPLVTPPDPPPMVDAATLALNGDGSLALVSHGGPGGNGQLAVRNTATGAVVTRLDPALVGGRKVFFPEWSPDGRDIVATLATRDENAWTVSDGSIAIIPYDNGQFGGPRIVVPEDVALFHFYPSWSPDGRWIVFASAPVGGNSYHNPQARLRLVSRAGDRPIELARATHLAGRTSTWPRFAPVTQANGNVLFISFDSNIDYGYLLKNDLPTGGRPQLWLAAIDLRKLGPGNDDPSGAPVWLPFQDTLYANVLGAWTERLLCGPQSLCPDGARCESGRCVSMPR